MSAPPLPKKKFGQSLSPSHYVPQHNQRNTIIRYIILSIVYLVNTWRQPKVVTTSKHVQIDNMIYVVLIISNSGRRYNLLNNITTFGKVMHMTHCALQILLPSARHLDEGRAAPRHEQHALGTYATAIWVTGVQVSTNDHPNPLQSRLFFLEQKVTVLKIFGAPPPCAPPPPQKKRHPGRGGGGAGGSKSENSLGDKVVSQNDDSTRGKTSNITHWGMLSEYPQKGVVHGAHACA